MTQGLLPAAKRSRTVADFDDQLWPIFCAVLVLAGVIAGMVVPQSDFADLRLFYNGWTRLAAVALGGVLLFGGMCFLQGKLRRRLLLAVLLSLLVHLSALGYVYRHPLAVTFSLAMHGAVAPGELADESDEPTAVLDEHWARIEQPAEEQSFERPIETALPEETAPATVIGQQQDETKRWAPAPNTAKVFHPTTPAAPAAQPDRAEVRRADASSPRLLEKFAAEKMGRKPAAPVEVPATEAQESAPAAAASGVEPLQPGAGGSVRRVNPPRSSRLAAAAALAEGTSELAHPLPSMTELAQLPADMARRAAALQQTAPGPEIAPSRPGTLARSDHGGNLPSLTPAQDNDAPLAPARAGGSPSSRLEATSQSAVTRSATPAPNGKQIAASGTAEFGIGSGHITARTGVPYATGTERPSLAGGSPARWIPRTTGGIGPAGRPILDPDAELAAADPALAAAGGGGGGRGGYVGRGGHDGDAALEGDVGRQPLLGAGLPSALPGIGRGAVRAGALDSLSDRGAPLPVGIARRATASQLGGDGAGLGPSLSATIARSPGGSNLPSAAAVAAPGGSPMGAGGLAATEGGATSKLNIGSAAGIGRGAANAPIGHATVPGGNSSFGIGAAPAAALAGDPGGGGGHGLSGPAVPPLLALGTPQRLPGLGIEGVYAVANQTSIARSEGRLGVDGVVHEPTAYYDQRHNDRLAQLPGGAGEGYTNRAVESGLEFFARLQFADGHWSLHDLPPGVKGEDAAVGEMQADTAATGLVLLGYLGAGYTHLDDKYRSLVHRGVRWLVAHQKPDGELFTGGTKFARMYSQGIAAMALCEAYGMTQDPDLHEPAQKAVDFILKSQEPRSGGWRYVPGEESDTSVTGWQLMALKSAEMAGLKVPAESLRRIGAWLDLSEAPGESSRYVYNPQALDTPKQRDGRRASLAMTAEAMLMRMYLGRNRDDPTLLEGAQYLKANLPEVGTREQPLRNCYYWYYATQAMFQMRGEYWTAWNNRLRPLLAASQVQSGDWAGSWHPQQPVADRWGSAGGRIYVTAMHVLMLEVYYRHLPLFQELGK